MTDQLDLDALDALADAATPGPWGTYQYGGDSLIEIAADLEDTGTGYRARRTIARFDEEPLDNDPDHREWTGEEDWAQVQADAAFIAAMSPEVAKALVAEVRRLSAVVDAVNTLCDEQETAARLFEFPTPEWITAVRAAIQQPIETDEMAASLARDGFGDDEITEILNGPRRASGPQTAASQCGAAHPQHPETVCTEPAGHYQPTTDPHAGPLVLDGRECGGAAWDEPAAPVVRSAD